MSSASSEMSSPPLRLTLIASLSPSNGLGVSGGLAWSLKREMAYFRKVTSFVPPAFASPGVDNKEKVKNAVIMGRSTWESIPLKFRPLKGRINVVVSRTVGEEREKELGISSSQDAYLVSSLSSALSLLKTFPSAFAHLGPSSESKPSLARTFLTGGSQIYAQALKSLTTPSRAKVEGSEDAILDHLLITRILSPEYDSCDVFLPEFRTSTQILEDRGVLSSSTSGTKGGKGRNEDQEPLQAEKWRKENHQTLQAFLGLEEVQKGVVTEGEGEETKYEFQLWTLQG